MQGKRNVFQRVKKGYVLAPLRHPGGYVRFTLYRDGRYENRYSHDLILQTFCGPRPLGAQACHNNGVKTDNRLENLRWDTASANQADRERHGTSQRGKSRHLRTLTRDEVRKIRALRPFFNITQIAQMVGRHRTTVADIVRGRTWRKAV